MAVQLHYTLLPFLRELRNTDLNCISYKVARFGDVLIGRPVFPGLLWNPASQQIAVLLTACETRTLTAASWSERSAKPVTQGEVQLREQTSLSVLVL